MELWIRSQDKKVLIKVEKLFYHCSCDEMESIATFYIGNKKWIGDKEYILLGEYKTKERALEVLDDISSKIKNQFIVQVNGLLKPSDQQKIKERFENDYVGDFIMSDGMLDIKPINQNLFLYEMPQE